MKKPPWQAAFFDSTLIRRIASEDDTVNKLDVPAARAAGPAVSRGAGKEGRPDDTRSQPQSRRKAEVVRLHPQAPSSSNDNASAARAPVVDFPRLSHQGCGCASGCVHERRRRKFIARQAEIRALAREVGLRDGTITPEPEPEVHYWHGARMPGGWTFCRRFDIRCRCDPQKADACWAVVERCRP